MKRIIFDVDNTLLPWKNKYLEAIEDTTREYNLNIDYKKINEIIEAYENYYDYYSKENMVNLINNKCNLNLGIDFINCWLDKLEKMADRDDGIIDLLEYLSTKYELVILTNWFKNNQIERLKHAGIYHFFKKIYAGEETLKPNKQSFLTAIGNKKPEECIIIGDNYEIDIKVAYQLGLRAFLIDANQKYPESEEYTKINNITDLKELL